MKLAIPSKENLFMVTEEDSLDLYFTPIIRNIYLQRFKLVIDLMDKRRYESLLDIGYGCGIFLKELSLHTGSLHGVDIHENADKVKEMFEKEGFSAELKQGDLFSLPYENSRFKCVVAMSVLEHLTELDRAMSGISRVCAPDADIILGFPVKNCITDSFFWSLGWPPQKIHPSTHNDILKAIKRNFTIVDMIKYPRLFPINLGLYLVIKCRKLPI